MANVIFKLEFPKIENFQLKKVMNIKARVKGKFGHVVQIQVCRLP